ncbi:MAG: heavy metal translocating P-type ATPase [Lautropia sp.]|nr:heavy metal translocating P-type ATPase [Lautropia sp.]
MSADPAPDPIPSTVSTRTTDMLPPGLERFAILDDPEEQREYARPLADDPTRLEAILALDAVHCAACTQTISSALNDEHARIEVNVVSRRARLEWDPTHHALSALLSRLAHIGYEPRPLTLDLMERADPRPRRRALWRMLVGIFCMMQVMMFAVPRYLGGNRIPLDLQQLMIWAEAMLTVPALFFAAGPFFSAAWRDTRQGRIGMDTPVALGIAITVLTSLIGFRNGQQVYFDSVTMIIGLLMVARWLESRARERAASGLGNSLARLPEAADRLGPDGRIERVSRRRLQPGDRISVPAGTTFAVDGCILDGQSDVDESLLSGESDPQPRGPGMPVVSGSLNLRNPLIVEVTHSSTDSRLAELNRLVERAAASRPMLLQTADRYAGSFLAGILLVALLAGIIWWFIDPGRAPWIAAAILIVTCPCALALSAPSALLATLGGLARRGIIVNRSDTLETLATAQVVLFDKTGTLSTSRPAIELIQTSPGLAAAEAMAIAAAIERSSLHPVARAFAEAATRSATTLAETHAGQRLSALRWGDKYQILDVTNLSGGGLQARLNIDDRPWTATITPDQTHIRLQLQPAFAQDGTPASQPRHALFRLTETLRPGAASAVAQLRKAGLHCQILSGDHPERVSVMGRQLDIADKDQHASARPEDKLRLMQHIQQQGRCVIMVGDGVNDAPVLSQANVSVSLASAAPLAQHHADILLLSEHLDDLLIARQAARRALRIVRQNLIFACLYNVLAIPLAAVGLVPPWLAGLGMAGSSLVVVLNALRASH